MENDEFVKKLQASCLYKHIHLFWLYAWVYMHPEMLLHFGNSGKGRFCLENSWSSNCEGRKILSPRRTPRYRYSAQQCLHDDQPVAAFIWLWLIQMWCMGDLAVRLLHMACNMWGTVYKSISICKQYPYCTSSLGLLNTVKTFTNVYHTQYRSYYMHWTAQEDVSAAYHAQEYQYVTTGWGFQDKGEDCTGGSGQSGFYSG